MGEKMLAQFTQKLTQRLEPWCSGSRRPGLAPPSVSGETRLGCLSCFGGAGQGGDWGAGGQAQAGRSTLAA